MTDVVEVSATREFYIALDLVVEAMRLVNPGIRLVIAGHGTQRENVEPRAVELAVAHRVHFADAVDDETEIDLYAGVSVVFAPFDEDFGYATLDSFLACKRVIMARGSGGPLEFVEDYVNGAVCEPTATEIVCAINRFAGERSPAAASGEAGGTGPLIGAVTSRT